MELDKILEFHPDTKEYVTKIYNLDKPEKMEQGVVILQEWLTKQDHFTKRKYDRRYLESLLIDAKGSIDDAKDKLEKRCIFRTLLPHFFQIDDFHAEFGELFKNLITGFSLPQLTKEHYRVNACKLYDSEFFKNGSYLLYYKLTFIISEYLKLHDRCAGYIHLIDFRDVTMMDVILKLKPHEFKQWVTYYLEFQATRWTKIIYLTNSKTIDMLINLLKPLFGTELAEKIEVYQDLEDIVHIVPREMWPIEFGGKTEISAKENQENWVKILSSKEFMDYYKDMSNARVDENIKPIDRDDTFLELTASVSLDFD